MKSWMKSIKSEFSGMYSEIGRLPVLTINPLFSAERSILILGSEFGDRGFCAESLLDIARKFSGEYKPFYTKIALVPVIDTSGHPGKCEIISSTGFESPSYLLHGKPSKDIPTDVRDLLSFVRNEKYNIVLQATSIARENWPYCDGYFVVPSVYNVVSGEKSFLRMKEETKDIAGTILSAAKQHTPLQSMHTDGVVGDRYVLAREGMLLPASVSDDFVEVKARNILSLACLENKVECITLVAPSSKKADNTPSRRAHAAALEAVIRLYEKNN
ncbi:MAG: hypothetical protein PHO02_04750 [Candidatus Nanoarchaeia archaeon]|nr:hypothetical protein [Candidatus Nanoarchaeia archaeon]